MTWSEVVIDEIFEVARGGSPRPIDKYITDSPDGVNWVMIGDASASNKYIETTKQKIRPEGVKKSREVKPGDFLLTNSMSFGRPYIMRTSGCIHDGWLLLRPRSKNIHPDFFYHFLGSSEAYQRFAARAPGSTVKNLNSGIVKETKVPLPPINEQKRIAAILDQADSLRRARHQAIEKLNSLSQAIFYEMFGDPRTNSKNMPMDCLGNLIKVSSGDGLTTSDQRGGDYPVYGGNGINGWHDEFNVPERTIIIGRVGVYCGAVHVTQSNAWVTDNALKVTLKKPMKVTYLASALKYAHLNQYAGRSSQPLVSGTRIYPVEIIVPDQNEQLKFEEATASQVEHIKKLERHEKQLETLFRSLQQRAFRGEL